MKSIVEVEINIPQKEAAELYVDPRNNLKWMHDIARYEPLSGEQGMPGFTYRLVPKEGDMIFVATVIERNLPDELKLYLEASDVDVGLLYESDVFVHAARADVPFMARLNTTELGGGAPVDGSDVDVVADADDPDRHQVSQPVIAPE